MYPHLTQLESRYDELQREIRARRAHQARRAVVPRSAPRLPGLRWLSRIPVARRRAHQGVLGSAANEC